MYIGFTFYGNEMTWNSSAIEEKAEIIAEQWFQAMTHEMTFYSFGSLTK